MRRNLEWFEGAPEKLEPGMVIIWPDKTIELVGTEFSADLEEICHEAAERWAWLVTPAELEWLEAMAATNAKSRPEQ